MFNVYSDSEIKNLLKEAEIIVDTREKGNDSILQYFKDKKIKFYSRALGTGDYSIKLNDKTLERNIVIEYKGGGLNELCSNFTSDRKRFEAEFMRAKMSGLKIFLIIKGANWEDIFNHNYKSDMSPKSLYGSIMSWIIKYDINIIFCDNEDAGNLIYGILHYYLKYMLHNGL